MEENVNKLIELRLLEFYGWWQLSVCFFAFAALMGIWWHIGRKLKEYGQIWLALSVLCWAMSGIIEVYYASSLEISANAIDESLLNGWRSIFSLLNSLFILLSLPYFKYIPEKLKNLIKSNTWYHIIGWPFLFSFLPTINKMIFGNGLGVISELDFYYSIFTTVFLALILFESFHKRGLTIMAWLAIVCCGIIVVAQAYKLTDASLDLTLYSAIFKTTLIMLFFALALSWVKELTENIIPGSEHLHLKLSKIKQADKYQHQVVLAGLIGHEGEVIQLTPAHYDLLLRFAQKRIDEDGWLEIKPKHEVRSDKHYDIKDHNEIKRLISALLDGLFGKGLWSKNKHEEPLKSSLFEMSEKRERKIRLAIPAKHITIPLRG